MFTFTKEIQAVTIVYVCSEVIDMDILRDAKSDNYRNQYQYVLKGYK
jgi:hypothetical protein